MRCIALLLAAVLTTASVTAQEAPGGAQDRAPVATAATPPAPSAATDAAPSSEPGADLPVSLDRIRRALERRPLFPVQDLGKPTFRVEVQERNRLQDILSTLDFSSGPTPAGGIYAAEMQRVMFPSVSNPLRQPYAAFSQPELLTIIIQNLAGRYLAGKIVGAVTSAEREAAEAEAREELRRAVRLYCAGQPNQGAGIKICTDPPPQ